MPNAVTPADENTWSRSSKKRPDTSCTPIASKKPGEMFTCAGATADSPGLTRYPSANTTPWLPVPLSGTVSVEPAARTPGSARRRSSDWLRKFTMAALSRYLARGNVTEAVKTPSDVNPGSTASTR